MSRLFSGMLLVAGVFAQLADGAVAAERCALPKSAW